MEVSESPEELARKALESNAVELELIVNPEEGRSEIPAEVWEIASLRHLKLSGWTADSLPPSISNLSQLTNLDLGNNSFSSLPWDDLPTGLQRLDVGFNSLREIPHLGAILPRLRDLDVGMNPLVSAPEWLRELPLHILGAAGTWMRSDPHWLGDIASLEELDLGGQPIRRFPSMYLPNLRRFSFWLGRLEAVPDFLRGCRKLEHLDLAANEIDELPTWLGGIESLVELNVAANHLTGLPSSLTNLRNLRTIRLGNNPFHEIPAVLFHMNGLRTVDLGQVDGYSIGGRSRNNEHLRKEVSSRKAEIHSIPGELFAMPHLRRIELLGLETSSPPPEILKSTVGDRSVLEIEDIERIRSYFRQIDAQGVDHLLEAKVLVVGEGGAGKTSLARKLNNPRAELPKDDDSTRGIEVSSFTFEQASRPFRVNIWDFGGQEIYHATHQFFLTKRSLYLLLADNRREDANFGYWMNVIELLSNASPVILVLNEKGGRRREIDESGLRARFPNLIAICSTNLGSGEGLESVIAEIRHQVVQLPHVGAALPARWVQVREALESLEDDFVDVDVFYRVCDDCGFRERTEQLELSGYLHDLGVFLHFQDDHLLSRIVILKSQWGTDAVYRVLDDPQVVRATGRFTLEDVRRIWHEERFAGMHAELVQLMVRFRLCYEVPGERGVYLAPQLLPEGRPDLDLEAGDLRVMYRYSFMPKGIVLRLIVELNALIDDDRVWRRGCVVAKDGALGQVEEDSLTQEIVLTARGGRGRELLSIMCWTLDRINDGFPRMTFEKLYPCRCDMCVSRSDRHYFAFTSLSLAIDRGVPALQCMRSFEMIPVKHIVDTVREFERDEDIGGSGRSRDIGPASVSTTHFAGPVEAVYMSVRDETPRAPDPHGSGGLSGFGPVILALIVVGVLTVLVGVLVSPVLVPIVLVAAVVMLVVVGATALRSSGDLSEEGALAWLREGLSRLHLLGRTKDLGRESSED